jgi:hypothetical protein
MRAVNGGVVKALLRSLDEPEAAQRGRLAQIAAGARGTAFAREHGLVGTESLEEWRAKIPVRTHAELSGWLDRVAGGEPEVLTRAPVRSLLETSGTTGRPKWLPVTDAWARTVAEAQAAWVLALLRDDEQLRYGKALSVVSPAEHTRSPGGLVVGSNTGRMFLAQPWWVRWRAPVPYAVYCIEDPALRAYCVLRHALAQPVTSWTTANPSTILLYCRRMAEWWEDLRADCADGTLSRGPAAGLGAADRKRLGKGAGRVRLGDDPRPTATWKLRRINCWTGGSAPFFLGRMPAALGAEVPVREAGVSASEGFFAVALDDEGPISWLTGHLLELVDDDGPHWPWEAEVGREYRLVVSTEAGLYRYDMGDIVRVTGWAGRAPRMVFVRKAGNVLNAMGEKVTEDQVIEAARRVFPGALGVSTSVGWGEVPVIRFAVEGAEADAAAFDRVLSELNVEYEGRRSSGRMGMPEGVSVPNGTFAAWRDARVRAGAPDAQVKDPIVLDPERWDALVRG